MLVTKYSFVLVLVAAWEAATNLFASESFDSQLPRVIGPRKSNKFGIAPPFKKRETPKFLNLRSQQFVVNGTSIPDVPFDVGESYAGLIPISQSRNETRKLYFWFFPSSNPAPGDEIVIWLNGGPGCSSLTGFLTENGPFLWQSGTLTPTVNPYSWTNLTNMVWVEQPVGTGFSQGSPNITNEVELALEFAGFWQNFVDTFGLKGVTTYITGESYAGYFVPYIADTFINKNDSNYFKLGGIAINSAWIGDLTIQREMLVYPFVEYWHTLFNLNQTYMNALRWTFEHCNYSAYIDKYATYPPPPAPFPVPQNPYHLKNRTCHISYLAYAGIIELNPCFNIYHITDTCPYAYNQLGPVNQADYVPPHAPSTYFNRADVKAAINAPDIHWHQCTRENTFGDGHPKSLKRKDGSLSPAQTDVLRRVIEHTNNTIIGGGGLDYLIPTNSTLIVLQNTTWHGVQGFQKYPQDHDFYVPYHKNYNGGRKAEAGIVGSWGYERGLTYYHVRLGGHQLPGYAAGAGYRVLELMLGKIPNLSSTQSFTTET